MTDPLSLYEPSLVDIVASQPLASVILGFLLLYALLTLVLRLADWIDPPTQRSKHAGRIDPPTPKLWRFRKPA